MRGCSACSALVVAVAVATAYLPGYGELTKRSDLGQMIRVRAANGQVLVSMGPSFGRWLPYDQIPAEMRAAIVSTEDRRFRSHLGVDPIGIARSIQVRLRSGHWRQGGSTITQQLARNIFLTNNRTLRAQGQGGHPRARARAQVQQGSDPRALSQPRLFRRRRLRDRRGLAQILRARRRSSEPRRSGDHRRTGEGALELFADRRRRSGEGPFQRRPSDDGDERLHHSRSGRGGRPGEGPNPANDQQQQRPLFHRLGASPARHADRPDDGPDRRLDDARSRNAGRRRQGDPRQCPRRRPGRAGVDGPRRRRPGAWSAARIM